MKHKLNKMRLKKYKKSKNKPLVTGLDPLVYNDKKFTQKINITS